MKIFAPKCFNWVVGGRGVTSHHPPYSIVDDYIFSCCRHEKLYCTEPESLQWWCKMKCWNLKWKILKISCSSRLTMYVHLCLSSSSTFWDCTFYVSTYVLTSNSVSEWFINRSLNLYPCSEYPGTRYPSKKLILMSDKSDFVFQLCYLSPNLSKVEVRQLGNGPQDRNYN